MLKAGGNTASGQSYLLYGGTTLLKTSFSLPYITSKGHNEGCSLATVSMTVQNEKWLSRAEGSRRRAWSGVHYIYCACEEGQKPSQMIFIFLAGKRVNYRLYSSEKDSRVTIVCCTDSAKPGFFNVLINGHFRTLNTISFFHFLVGIFSSFLLGPFLARWAARWIDSSDCSQVRVQLYMHGWSCKVIICWRICFIGYCCV